MKKIFYSLCCIVIASCGTDEAVVEKAKQKNDSSFTLEAKHLVVKDAKDLTDAKGILGIFLFLKCLL
ncbi:MAG: hypothetical protein IPJ60_11955 [Sphingobacteriaceae bacterium]|nr:hypothetical protein [Sphingobacteriaceae bacterium]